MHITKTLRQHASVALPLFVFSAAIPTYATEETDLFDMPLESLMNIEVTSVSKKEEKLSEAASAIYVITQEDIRRGGFTNVPEALRMVPGIHVAQIDSYKWAITSRGFNRQFSNKLLVLIDGRTVYTPLFSGVFWDVQDTVIEDIERIEVIRGPGATLWGANAVNGVINIITKKAKDTQGTLASVGAGYNEEFLGTVRQGGKLENGHYRLYAKRNDRKATETLAGNDAGDDWYKSQVGFRSDWKRDSKLSYTLQGDAYDVGEESRNSLPILTPPFTNVVNDQITAKGFNLLTRFDYEKSATSKYRLQAYIDYTARDTAVLDQQRATYDLDFQHNLTVDDRNEVVWGMGYRYTKDNLNDSAYLNYTPDSDSYDLINIFVQDKFALAPDKLYLTVGAKVEHNDYTSFEPQPSARLSWLVDEQRTVWASVARAIRTPSRAETGLNLVGSSAPAGAFGAGTPASFITQVGGADVTSEKLLTYELGYRYIPNQKVSVDVTTFYNDYEDLRTFEAGAPFVTTRDGFGPHLEIPFLVDNKGYGNSFGIELATNWQVTNDWRLEGSYTFLNMDLDTDIDSSDPFLKPEEGNSPHNMANLRSYWNVSKDVEWDNSIYYVDNLATANVDSYIRLDTRLGYHVADNIELSLIGTNLLDDWHQEFSQGLYGRPSEIGRSIFGKITLRY
jgi:iron complex outermembrane receptor protein